MREAAPTCGQAAASSTCNLPGIAWLRLFSSVHLPMGLLPLQAQFVSPQELQFAQQKGLPVIDVRPLSEYEAGRIPGSKHAQFMRAITGRQRHRPHPAVCCGQGVAGGGCVGCHIHSCPEEPLTIACCDASQLCCLLLFGPACHWCGTDMRPLQGSQAGCWEQKQAWTPFASPGSLSG